MQQVLLAFCCWIFTQPKCVDSLKSSVEYIINEMVSCKAVKNYQELQNLISLLCITEENTSRETLAWAALLFVNLT